MLVPVENRSSQISGSVDCLATQEEDLPEYDFSCKFWDTVSSKSYACMERLTSDVHKTKQTIWIEEGR